MTSDRPGSSPSLQGRAWRLAARFARGEASVKEVMHALARRLGYEKWPVRVVRRAPFEALLAELGASRAMVAELLQRQSETDLALAEMHALRMHLTDLRRELDKLSAAHDYLREEHSGLRTALDGALAQQNRLAAARDTAARSVTSFMDLLAERVFGVSPPMPAAQAAASAVMAGEPGERVLETFIVISHPEHGKGGYRALAPVLAPRRALPQPLRTALHEWIDRFRIIDIGSEQLNWENDIYAPLALEWPCETIGFDPFEDAASGERQRVIRPDGRVVETIPALIGDGEQVTFYTNRASAASSTLPANHALTKDFGLLDLSLETISEQQLSTRRLDDLFAEGTLFKDRVDLLKIDVQGAALAVLAGAENMLARTLIVHVESEFAEVYKGENLFADVDAMLRARGFGFLDFFELGRQAYAALTRDPTRFQQVGRTLWADCIYVAGLDKAADDPAAIARIGVMLHQIYNRQDAAAEMFARYDKLTGESLLSLYLERVAQ